MSNTFRRASDLKTLTLNPKATLGEGGEGSVFAAGNRLAAKIYRKPSEAIQQKLKAMLAQTSANALVNQDVGIAWPLDLLLDEAGQIVGFLMPQALAARPIVDYYNPKTRLSFSPLFSYRDLHRTARNLAAAIEKLHAQGYIVGDLNESNILVTQSAQVTLVDADSIQVIDGETLYHCRVGKAEFMPPELQGQSLSTITRTAEQDNFALAILIFQTLMEGSHPYAGIYTGEGEPPTLAARIAAGHFPYGDQPVPYRPSPLALPFTLLHPKLQAFFQCCFVDSQENPQIRPTAAHWREALTLAEQELRPCTVNPRHAYGSHLDACPWCFRKALLKDRDPFPEKVDLPKPTPVVAKPKKLPVFGILVGISFAFIAAMVAALWVGEYRNGTRPQWLESYLPKEPPKPREHKPNPYYIGKTYSEKLQISFCKSGNQIAFPESNNKDLLKGFEAHCQPSSLKLASNIFKQIYPSLNKASDIQNYDSASFEIGSESARDFLPMLSGNTLSPNGQYFASKLVEKGNSTYVLLTDTSSNKLIRRINTKSVWISVVTFSPDSKKLAIGQDDGVVKIFSVTSGALISELHVADLYISDLKFVENGTVLCIGIESEGFRFVSIPSGKIIRTSYLSNSDSTIAFSFDEKRFAFICGEYEICVSDTHSGKVLIRMDSNGDNPGLIVFSKDGKRLAIRDWYTNEIAIYDLKL
jgi:serine/threonine protein kinase